MASRAYM